MDRKNETKVPLIIAIFLGIAIVFPFLPLLINGKVIYWGTSTTQFLPWLNYAFRSISQGNFPLWNPDNGMGSPFLANYQSALFYIPNWILWFFFKIGASRGLAFGLTLSVVLHLYFSSIGMYVLLKYLKRTTLSAFFGSVIWVFGGYAVSRISFFSMIWSFSWVSWIIYALLLLRDAEPKNRLRRILLLSILFSMQLLSGHAQTTYFTLIISLFMLFFPIRESLNAVFKNFVFFNITILTSILLSAIQLIPTAEYLLLSQRSQEVGFDYALNFSYWPLRILSVVFGNFWGDPGITRYFGGGVYWEDSLYIGIFPLILIAILLLYFFQKWHLPANENAEKNFLFVLIVLAVLAFLFSLGRNFFLYPLFYKYIPTFNMFQAPSRFLMITNFCLAIISSFALDHWLLNKYNPRKVGILIVTGVAFIVSTLGSMFLIQGIPKEIYQSILVTGSLIIIFGIFTILKNLNLIKNKQLIIIFFVAICCINVILVNFPYGNFIGSHYLETISETNKKFEHDTVFINSASEEFLKFNRYFRFDRFQFLEDLKTGPEFLIPNTNLIDPSYKMVNNFDPFQPKKYTIFMNWINQLNANQQISMLKMVGASVLTKLDINSAEGYRIQKFEGKEIVQWYECSVGLKTDVSLDWILYNESSNSDERCIVVGKGNLEEKPEEDLLSSLTSLDFKQNNINEISINYSTKKEGWLVIRQLWFPGWNATLDSVENISIQEVDFMFQGLFVPAGTHTILLKYKPLSFTIGLYISLFSWIIFIILCVKIIASSKKL